MCNSCLLYHNPTQAAFLESGTIELQGLDDGILKLHSDYRRFRWPFGVKADDIGNDLGNANLKGDLSGKNIQDNTILSIEILRSYPLKVPIANSIINAMTSILESLNPTPPLSIFIVGQLPCSTCTGVASFLSFRYHAPPTGGSGGYEAFDIVMLLWNSITSRLEGAFEPAEPQIGFFLDALDMGVWAADEPNNVKAKWGSASLQARVSLSGTHFFLISYCE
ncbi:MAG: hypothetical protein H7240_06210 [Glaciimonas sp.]|nr:hypothetical protein [Glaciimonas sp.]